MCGQADRNGAVLVSAASGEGKDELLARMSLRLDNAPERTFQLQPDDGEALAWLYQHGRVTGRYETEHGLAVTARLDSQALGRFERMRP